MRISAGIFVIALGAIIAFGIRDTSGPINLTVVGVVIMLAGAAGLYLSFLATNRRRQAEVTLLDPSVEDQYKTEPHHYPLDEQIDVTPDDRRPRP